MSDTTLMAGSHLKVTVPEGTSIVNGPLVCAISGFYEQDNLACTGQDSNIVWFAF